MKQSKLNAPICHTPLLQFSKIERGDARIPRFHYRIGRMNRVNGKDRHNGINAADLVPIETAPTRRKQNTK